MPKRTLLYGAVVLFATNLLNSVFGFISQMLVLRAIGPEGLGLILMALPVYLLALVVAMAGIPTSVARIVAEAATKKNYSEVRRIFSLGLIMITTTSFLSSVILYALIPLINSSVLQDPRAYRCLMVLIPSIYLTALCSLYRGYFQGLKNMVPTGLSEILEEAVGTCLGLFLAYLYLPRGIEYAAVGYIAGMVFGDLAGLAFLIYLYGKQKKSLPVGPFQGRTNVSLARDLFKLSMPITAAGVASTIIHIIDSVMIPSRLHKAGFSIQQCTKIYGEFTGIGLALLTFPSVLTTSLAATLIPGMSEAAAREEHRLVRGRASDSIRITIMGGLPVMIILLLIPTQVSNLFFGIPEAGDPVRILATASLFLYLFQTTTGILQGLGKVHIPLRSIVVASSAKFTLIYLLTAIPGLNIYGTALAFVANYIIASLSNLFSLAKETGLHLSLRQVFFKPAMAAIGMALTLTETFRQVLESTGNANVSAAAAMASGLAVYLGILIWNGGITRLELKRLINLR